MPMEIRVKQRMQRGIFLTAALTILAATCQSQMARTENDPRQTALSLEQIGKNAEAEDAWRAVLKAHPGNAEAYAHMGFLEARQEHYKEAVPLYRKALTLNPAMPSLKMNFGLALFKPSRRSLRCSRANLLLPPRQCA